MQIHPAARRHGIDDQDVDHALERALAWVELGDDPQRYLVVGPGSNGLLLELVVMRTELTEMVIHAMALRRSTEREVFGGESQ